MLEDKVYYEVVVEAANEEEAIEMAPNMACDDDIVSESYLEVVETEEL
jgi:hypothetical protein